MNAIVNDKKLFFNNDKLLIQSLIMFFSRHFPFQSVEVIQKNFTDLLGQIGEGLTLVETKNEAEKKEIAKLKRKMNLSLKILSKIKSKEALVTMVYNLLLSLDGLGTLNGFGVCTHFGDNLYINPEKQSLTSLR